MVGRIALAALLAQLGAELDKLSRREAFVPIDNGAVSVMDETTTAAAWCRAHLLDAVVSTDGDRDRSWVCDERDRCCSGE